MFYIDMEHALHFHMLRAQITNIYKSWERERQQERAASMYAITSSVSTILCFFSSFSFGLCLTKRDKRLQK